MLGGPDFLMQKTDHPETNAILQCLFFRNTVRIRQEIQESPAVADKPARRL